MELRTLSLAQIRQRLAQGELAPGEALLDALRRDPRRGAVRLVREIESRRERIAGEVSRLAALFSTEEELRAAGVERIAGVDEVGMGPLAGPVVAAAVVLPAGLRPAGLDDSKRLSRAARERLDREIRAAAIDWAIGSVDTEEIDRIDIHRAGLLAMRRALEGLRRRPQLALVDARHVPGIDVPQRAFVGGDARIGSIAAASVVAKVWRDTRMCELDRRHPGYGFARNAGYGTAEHLRALDALGPSGVHRRSFAPVRAVLRSGEGTPRAAPEAAAPLVLPSDLDAEETAR
jgi:ribonuclease HII